ncbi:MAG TPA: ComF family protein [Candidatus Eisenbergiella merdipullorum]|uniref:ComF family protein n=1 Tax=Candidatus Eisenbergiella merdipullorum TaxID=2838553 RepID=A0A9D2I794_9FIRM|nr:ComF family protein [Candidatus Eisenbergiella merdipullorum]
MKIHKKFFQILTDLLFPRRCPVCDRPVRPFGRDICASCKDALIPVGEPRCLKCGKQLNEEGAEYCYDCSRRRHMYDRGAALYTYACIRQTIYRFKYAGRREYADFLGRMLAENLGGLILSWHPDALIPIPLHPEREKARGYNQAALLAQNLGKRLDIPVLSGYLVRVKNTRPQKELEGAARQNNLKKAFKIVQDDVKLNTIVIIDDIYTTGSTIDAAALECRRAGVRRVFFITLAIGKGL